MVLASSSSYASSHGTPYDHAIRMGVVLTISAYARKGAAYVMHTVYLPDMLRRTYG